MTGIPLPVLVIGWAGLIPFIYGVLLVFLPEDANLPTFGLFAPAREGGVVMLQNFGAVVLGFMGGCLWGFASGTGRVPTFALLLASAVPALLAAVAIRSSPALSCIWLAFGYVVLQGIDVTFQRAGVAPAYWLNLRLPLTAGVIACLLVGALYG